MHVPRAQLSQVVHARIPLHKIASVVHVAEDSGQVLRRRCTRTRHWPQHLVVFEAPVDLSTQKSSQFKYLVYECSNEVGRPTAATAAHTPQAEAKKLAKAFRQAFELMLTKTTLENVK